MVMLALRVGVRRMLRLSSRLDLGVEARREFKLRRAAELRAAALAERRLTSEECWRDATRSRADPVLHPRARASDPSTALHLSSRWIAAR